MISMAMVPCPVATSRSSKGCTNVAPVSSAISYAFAQASSKTSPERMTSAPYALVRLIFMRGVMTGMQTVAGTPARRAAKATPWAWFPADAVISPFFLASSLIREIL